MPIVLLLALTGRRLSGKSTVASLLEQRLLVEIGDEVEVDTLSFATPLKDLVRHMFHLNYQQLIDPVLKERVDERWGVSPRQLLQGIGTGLFRDHLREAVPGLQMRTGSSIWTTLMQQELDAIVKCGYDCVVIIDDVRFPDELALVERYGGNTFRVQRTEDEPQESTHESETALLMKRLPVIRNIGTLLDLEAELERLVVPLFGLSPGPK